jgi:hypothetical protein
MLAHILTRIFKLQLLFFLWKALVVNSIYLLKKYDGFVKKWHGVRSDLYFDGELNQYVRVMQSIMHRFMKRKFQIGLFPTLRTIIRMAFLNHIPSQMDIIFNLKFITSVKSKSDACLNTYFNNEYGLVAFILPVELDTRFCCLFCFHHWEQIK